MGWKARRKLAGRLRTLGDDKLEAKILKRKIFNENKIEIILEKIGMKHVNSSNDKFVSCCMPDGDNKMSTIVYKEEYVGVVAYTRDISNGNSNPDIISLVCFVKKVYFSNAIKMICDICGFNYYERDVDTPISLKWLNAIYDMSECEVDENDEDLYPVNDDYLLNFDNCSNIMFLKDGISHSTQMEFEVGFDLLTNSITIPIRDEIGTLVGVKARRFVESCDNKYFYIKSFPKSKVLYGLNKTYEHIVKADEVFVFEAEKSVQIAWTLGLKNCVAIGGHNISKTQAKKLSKLGVNIVLCYDSDIGKDEDGFFEKSLFIKQASKFMENQIIDVMFDFDNELESKQCPIENKEVFKKMYKKKERIQG